MHHDLQCAHASQIFWAMFSFIVWPQVIFHDVFMCLKFYPLYSGSLFGLACPDRQGWKAGNHCMGDVRPYQPEPPAARDEDNVDPKDYEFKLVVCEVNNTKKGWDRYKFTLPSHVRSMYARDIVYGADWRALLQEFDERCQACTGVLILSCFLPSLDFGVLLCVASNPYHIFA